jgi:hypothetical protein
MWNVVTLLLVIAFAAGAPTIACAQSPSDILQKLTGGSHRVWVFKRFDTILGPGQTCIRGEDADIRADHSIVLRTCLNGKVVPSTKTWEVGKKDGIDDSLIIGTDEYRLLFQDNGNTMILRKISHSKTTPTVDKIYRRERD